MTTTARHSKTEAPIRDISSNVHIDFRGRPLTSVDGDGWELLIYRDEPRALPTFALFAEERFIGSDFSVFGVFSAPTAPGTHAALALMIGETRAITHFDLPKTEDNDLQHIRINLAGAARPKHVSWTYAPSNPEVFQSWTPDDGDARTGRTNGHAVGLIFDNRPTADAIFVLDDFVEEWVDDLPRPDLVRSGLFVPLFRPTEAP